MIKDLLIAMNLAVMFSGYFFNAAMEERVICSGNQNAISQVSCKKGPKPEVYFWMKFRRMVSHEKLKFQFFKGRQWGYVVIPRRKGFYSIKWSKFCFSWVNFVCFIVVIFDTQKGTTVFDNSISTGIILLHNSLQNLWQLGDNT